MKPDNFKIILLLIFIPLSCKLCYCQSGWFQQNSSTNKTLHSVQFIDVNTGFACGAGIIILKTTNGGINWLVTYNSGSNSANLYSLNFINNSTGYAAGGGLDGIVMKTTDSGLNWQNQNTNTINFLNCIYFLIYFVIYLINTTESASPQKIQFQKI